MYKNVPKVQVRNFGEPANDGDHVGVGSPHLRRLLRRHPLLRPGGLRRRSAGSAGRGEGQTLPRHKGPYLSGVCKISRFMKPPHSPLSTFGTDVQGEPSGSSEPLVDIKTKVAFQYMLLNFKTQLLF